LTATKASKRLARPHTQDDKKPSVAIHHSVIAADKKLGLLMQQGFSFIHFSLTFVFPPVRAIHIPISFCYTLNIRTSCLSTK
jgi:hypothetical protein